MSSMPKQVRRGATSSYQEVSNLRDTAIRGLKENSHLCFSADKHKRVFNFLYVNYFTSNANESEIALEFWRCYRHIAEGLPITTLPIFILQKENIIDQLLILLDDELQTVFRDNNVESEEDENDNTDNTDNTDDTDDTDDTDYSDETAKPRRLTVRRID